MWVGGHGGWLLRTVVHWLPYRLFHAWCSCAHRGVPSACAHRECSRSCPPSSELVPAGPSLCLPLVRCCFSCLPFCVLHHGISSLRLCLILDNVLSLCFLCTGETARFRRQVGTVPRSSSATPTLCPRPRHPPANPPFGPPSALPVSVHLPCLLWSHVSHEDGRWLLYPEEGRCQRLANVVCPPRSLFSRRQV